MKKHYEFVKLNEKDIHTLRQMLTGDAWSRIILSVVALGIIGYLGYTRMETLTAGILKLIVFFLAIEIVGMALIKEISHVLAIRKIHKSNLVHYIHNGFKDQYFYSEELEEGFIVQVQPVGPEDVDYCERILEEKREECGGELKGFEYLSDCLRSSNRELVNKAVIYIEIIRDQLLLGNTKILDSSETIKYFMVKQR